MATVKELIQNFCYRKNIPAPSSIVGSSTPTAQQYLSLFQKIGDALRNYPYNWPQLKRGYTFNTVTGQTLYELPGDFYRILESTEWDVTNKWPMRGPISDYNMTVRQFAVVSLQTRKAFNLIGPTQHLYNISPYSQRSRGKFQIDPSGANDTDELFFMYVSCNWVWPRDWVTNTSYSIGDIRAGNGYTYIALNAATSGATRPNWSTGKQYDGGGSSGVQWQVYTEPYLAAPSNAALNDSDLCLFDEDLMIDGMNWAWLQAKKMDYQQERADWESSVKSAFARFNGPIRINMADEFGDSFEWPNIAPGSWNV